jgi:hypothetical protein
VKRLTKESKVKGKVFLPKRVIRNLDIQQEFSFETPKKKASRKAIKLSDISPQMRSKVFDRPSKLAYQPFSKTI